MLPNVHDLRDTLMVKIINVVSVLTLDNKDASN